MRCLLVLVSGTIAIAACQTRSTTEAPQSTQTCPGRAATLSGWLRSLAADGTGHRPQSLPVLSQPPPAELTEPVGPSMVVNQHEVLLDGAFIGRLDPLEQAQSALATELMGLRADVERAGLGETPELLVHIHKDTALSIVAPLLERVRTGGFQKIHVAFARPSTLLPPSTSILGERIERVDPAGHQPSDPQDATPSDQLPADHPTNALWKDCADAGAALGALYTVGLVGSHDDFMTELEGHLVRCGCAVDDDGIKEWVWWISGRRHSNNQVVDLVSVSLAANGERVELPGATTWAVALPLILQAARGQAVQLTPTRD